MIAFYEEMTGSADERRALDNVYLDFRKILTNWMKHSRGPLI